MTKPVRIGSESEGSSIADIENRSVGRSVLGNHSGAEGPPAPSPSPVDEAIVKPCVHHHRFYSVVLNDVLTPMPCDVPLEDGRPCGMTWEEMFETAISQYHYLHHGGPSRGGPETSPTPPTVSEAPASFPLQGATERESGDTAAGRRKSSTEHRREVAAFAAANLAAPIPLNSTTEVATRPEESTSRDTGITPPIPPRHFFHSTGD